VARRQRRHVQPAGGESADPAEPGIFLPRVVYSVTAATAGAAKVAVQPYYAKWQRAPRGGAKVAGSRQEKVRKWRGSRRRWAVGSGSRGGAW